MATNSCDANHFQSDSLLPPRKRLLAGFKKQNSEITNDSPSPPFASSSSTTTSNGSSSASTDVQTHLDSLLTSQLHNQTQSPEEIAQTAKANASLAVKVAKAARATANEKAMIASKAVAAAKTALELLASFPKERSPRKNKQKKHVPVQLLYSKGGVDEELEHRLNRAINNSPRVLKDYSGHRNKKQKSVVTSTMYDGHDVAGIVDSDSSNDEEVDRIKVNGKLILYDRPIKEKTGEESSSLGKRRGRMKLKKLPLSMCASKEHENGITKLPLEEKNVVAGPSWKSQEYVKQNKVVRS